MQQKPLLDLFLPTCGAERLSEATPSHPVPAGGSSCSRSAGCERGERSWQSPAGAAAGPSAPFLPFSSAGSDCSSRNPDSPSPSTFPCPGSAACNPPLPLGLSGSVGSSPISATEQSLCMAASAHPSILEA